MYRLSDAAPYSGAAVGLSRGAAGGGARDRPGPGSRGPGSHGPGSHGPGSRDRGSHGPGPGGSRVRRAGGAAPAAPAALEDGSAGATTALLLFHIILHNYPKHKKKLKSL